MTDVWEGSEALLDFEPLMAPAGVCEMQWMQGKRWTSERAA